MVQQSVMAQLGYIDRWS